MLAEPWLVGLSAALVQLAAGEFAAAVHGTHTSPLRAIGRWLIDALPTPLIDLGIALLRRLDKPAIAVLLVLFSLGLPSVAAQAGPVALVLLQLFLGTVGLVALWRRIELGRAAASSIGLVALGAGLASIWLVPSFSLTLGVALMLIAAIVRAQRRGHTKYTPMVLPTPQRALPPPSDAASLAIPDIPPLFTPVEQFFVTDVTFPAPIVDPLRWRLTVRGLVDHPLSLTLEELFALPSMEVDAVLMCVHNPVGGPFVGNARWQGARIADLLDRVGVSPHADHVRLHSVDGFSAGLSLGLLEQGFEPLLVYAMNGLPLTRTHGAPVRMLVPGIHGYDANIKWLESIEVTRFDDAIDYAERKGWPRVPSRMGPQCRIDVPGISANLILGEQVAAGVAWSPPHGVLRVELRVNGGAWQPCTLAEALGPSAWVQWHVRWVPDPGRQSLEVRAWGRDGAQIEYPAPPYPHGARGYHRIDIDVDARRPPRVRQFGWWIMWEARARLRLAWTGLSAWHQHRTGAESKHRA